MQGTYGCYQLSKKGQGKPKSLEALIAAVEQYNAGHATEDEDSDIDLAEEGAEDLEFGEEEDSDEDLYLIFT